LLRIINFRRKEGREKRRKEAKRGGNWQESGGGRAESEGGRGGGRGKEGRVGDRVMAGFSSDGKD